MVVGVGIIELWLGDCMSLKEKRSLLSRLLSRTRNEFNITLAEVGANDEWRRAIIGFSTVGNDRRHINGRMNCVLGFIERLNLAEIAASRFEILNFNTESISRGYGEDKYDEL